MLDADSVESYKILRGSSAISAGAIIAGSFDDSDYRYNNGGLDFFGNMVSESLPPHIGAYNGNEFASVDSFAVEAPTLSFPWLILLTGILMTIATRKKAARF